MTDDFSVLLKSVTELLDTFEKKGIPTRITSDDDSTIIKIYGEKSDSVSIAKSGLEGIEELAFTTAEHHPYWSLLYHGSQILKLVLEKWHDSLTPDEIQEIIWYADKIKNLSGTTTPHGHDE